MRRIVLSLTSVLASSTLMFGVAAATDSSCSIDNTGPDSTNTCTVSEDNSVTIKCKNDVDVVFINNQQASSGDSLVLNNTNGGYATSGNAQNFNTVDGKLDVSCAKAATTTSPAPTPAPASTPVAAPVAAAQPAPAGGQGQGQEQTPKAQALPNTGSNSVLTTATIATVAVGMLAALGRAGFSAYKFFNIK
jgi:hypothetical protein